MKKIILLAGLVLCTTFMATAQNDLSKSFSGIKKIRINTASGDCHIKKNSSAEVNVALKHTYDDSGYQPTMEQEGSLLVIKETFKKNHISGSATWTLSVPDDVAISFTTGSGDFEVAGLKSDMDITTGSGDLSFTAIKGEVKSTTGSGNIEMQGFDGKMKATTGSGDIKMAKSNGTISVTCGSGDIRLTDGQATLSATTGSGSIEGINVALNGTSRLTTGSGNIEVILSASPKFDLSMTSGSGDAELNFNGNEIRGEIVMKASKEHGNIRAPFEFDKTEEIDNEGNRSQTTIKKTVVKGDASNHISISTGSGDAIVKK